MILQSQHLLNSPNLHHGFSTRLGGLCQGSHSSFHLGVSDANPQALQHNLRRFRALLGLPAGTHIHTLNQVHGDALIAAPFTGSPHGGSPDGDALYTCQANIALGVRSADCAPLLIAALDNKQKTQAIAAVHAGWKSAVRRIAPKTVLALQHLGHAPNTLRIAIGPCIQMDAFEVGEEVVAAAQASLHGQNPPLLRNAQGKAHLDLRQLIVMQLSEVDIRPEQIEFVGGCTFQNRALHFSYRRQGKETGSQLSAIMFHH